MQCTVDDHEYRVGDVVLLSCSVEYSGYMVPSLTWTDDSGNKLNLTDVNSESNDSRVDVAR